MENQTTENKVESKVAGKVETPKKRQSRKPQKRVQKHVKEEGSASAGLRLGVDLSDLSGTVYLPLGEDVSEERDFKPIFEGIQGEVVEWAQNFLFGAPL